MARTLTPNDAHSIMNDVTRESCGVSAFAVIDNSSFVSAGEIAGEIANVNAFMITVQPSDFYGSVGETAVFKVEAIGTGLTYQWQYLNVGTTIWRNSVNSGSKTNTLSFSVTTAKDGQKYRCIIKDKNTNTLTSNEVTIHVI